MYNYDRYYDPWSKEQLEYAVEGIKKASRAVVIE